MLAKLGWPYLLRGRVRYARRLVGCAAISILGMWVSRTHSARTDGVRWVANGCSGETQIVAAFDTLLMRLLGICCASFSSGLGELTFLQLSTRYHPPSVAGHSVGYAPSTTLLFDRLSLPIFQVLRLRYRCCWPGRRLPMVGATWARRPDGRWTQFGMHKPLIPMIIPQTRVKLGSSPCYSPHLLPSPAPPFDLRTHEPPA